MKNRQIGKTGRVISDILETVKINNLESFLITMDMEKDHAFLISVLKKIWIWSKLHLLDKNP